MTKKRITVTVDCEDIAEFKYSNTYTVELYEDIRELYNETAELILVGSSLKAALDKVSEEAGHDVLAEN